MKRFLFITALITSLTTHASPLSGSESEALAERNEFFSKTIELDRNAILKNRFLRENFIKFSTFDRCARYTHNILSCKTASEELVKHLDDDIVVAPDGQEVVVVAFTKNLIRLLNSHEISNYLSELKLKMMFLKDTFNLWEITQNYTHDESKTIDLISTLFQDVSAAKAHIIYAKQQAALKKQSLVFDNNLKALDFFVDEFYVGLQSDYHFIQKIFPPQLGLPTRLLNPGFYHFYVPANLSQKIYASTQDPKSSYFVAFLFNYVYEILDNYKPVYQMKNYFFEPNSVSNHNLRDIYMGYAGALLGVSKLEKRLKPELFIKGMQLKPSGLLKYISK